ATVPSGYVWGSVSIPIQAAWTLGGQDVAYVPSSGAQPEITTDAAGNQLEIDAPVFLADIHAASTAALAAAPNAAAKTHGPNRMLAGASDQLWSSCNLSQPAWERLGAMGHVAAHADDYQCYSNAGHWFGTPDVPTTASSEYYDANFAEWVAIGGTPAGIA